MVYQFRRTLRRKIEHRSSPQNGFYTRRTVGITVFAGGGQRSGRSHCAYSVQTHFSNTARSGAPPVLLCLMKNQKNLPSAIRIWASRPHFYLTVEASAILMTGN